MGFNSVFKGLKGLILYVYFRKNSQISKFMKIRPMEAELFHTDGRTDGHDEANSRFSQFCDSA